ncbi:hypothetical protein GZH47_26085 [Paenibacillus rhizovicinus]|uniref:Copper amine oxidase-like N-terminal domain-containing protein n=1 Tax=Paenibacillus rhizovicinus TaxID=2704463 RepID=A0A6C0P652_9BACL|nr:stalk domain-containing protein [Paenibacillus rhizovicinus]QHW33925.1 hypothetical protein GZH47_26085 [Paenibacillus rhizovicinus]
MSMKKTLMISALAVALSTSAIGVASAATQQQTSASVPFNVMVNDSNIQVRSVQANGTTLLSLRDLGSATGALFVVNVKSGVTAYIQGHSIELHAGSTAALVDGEQVDLQQAVESVNGSYYIAIDDFLNAFGLDGAVDDAGQVWIDAIEKIHADNISWINSSQLLASSLTGEGRTDYIVDAASGKFTKVLSSDSASELTVSPDGKKAAYTDEDGVVYVIDLTSKNFSSQTVSTDISIKPELVWSADSSAIYFLQTDKGTVIQKLTIADGKLTQVMNDKVDYKSSLNVSADGTKFFYVVSKPGTVTADANKPVDVDDVAIDNTGTEPQVYLFDSSVKDAAAGTKLTSTTDDKVFVGALADGSKAYYVSVVDGQPSSLVAVAADKTVTKLIGDKDVLQATLAGNKIYALTDAGEQTALYEVDTVSGAVKLIGNLAGNVSEVVAAPGTPAAVVIDDATFVIQGSTLVKVTN